MARIVSIESQDQPYRCSCSNGIHTWYADEPERNNGGDTGPSPGELLLSAIGTCGVITLRMYANRKQWPVEKIILTLSLEEIKGGPGVFHRIHQHLELEGPLDEEQKSRMISLLPKCPVSRLVTGQVEIVYKS